MVELILRVIRAVLASLYVLFEGVPALDTLRSWFGGSGGPGPSATSLLLLLAAAAILGALAFVGFLWLLKRSPTGARVAPSAPEVEGRRQSDGGRQARGGGA